MATRACVPLPWLKDCGNGPGPPNRSSPCAKTQVDPPVSQTGLPLIVVPPREFETEHVSFRQCLTASLSAASSQVKRQVRYQAVSGHFSRPRGVSGRISDARHANGTGPRLPLSSLSPLQEGPQRIRRGLRVVRHAKLAPERIELVGVRLRPRNPLLSGLLLGGIGQARGDHLHGTDVVA